MVVTGTERKGDMRVTSLVHATTSKTCTLLIFTYLEWNVESVFHFKPVGLVFLSVTKICHTET